MNNTHTQHGVGGNEPTLEFSGENVLVAKESGYVVTIYPVGRTWRLMIGNAATDMVVVHEAYLHKYGAIEGAHFHMFGC